MKTISFQISDEAFELLMSMDGTAAEYRDTNCPTIADFRASDDLSHKGDDYYLNRNFGGTYHLIDQLSEYNLIRMDDFAWHQTFVLSDFGQTIVDQNK